jgi:hypothetical protein
MIAREAAAMLVEENFVGRQINNDRESEFGEEVSGYKKGDTVKVKIPPVPTVYDGSNFAGGGSAPSQSETYVNLTIDTQKHVPLSFTAKERKLDLAEFRSRFLEPAMTSLMAIVNADLLLRMKNSTPNVTAQAATAANARTPYRQASAILNRFLAPKDQRYLHFSEDANNNLAEGNATLFHTSEELRKEFDKNAVGMFAGFQFFQQQSNPVHTNGAGAGYLVNGAAQTGSGLIVDTGTGAINKGSVITIANVFAVHPLTGVSTGKLRQFYVTADYAGGGGTIQLYPAITPTTASVVGTVNASPADNAAVTIEPLVTAKVNNLGFHRNAFATAFPPLQVLASCEGYTATVDNVSVRVMTFGDGKADVEHTRVDVLYGFAAPRPDHSVRIPDA